MWWLFVEAEKKWFLPSPESHAMLSQVIRRNRGDFGWGMLVIQDGANQSVHPQWATC